MNNKLPGFTLFEILIVMGIITAVSILAFPISISQLQKTRVKQTASDIASQLYQFQQNAYARKNNKSYGLAFNQAQKKYYIYIGNSLATADEIDTKNLDSNFSFSQINLSGGQTEINFSAGSFKPSAYGNIILTDGNNSFRIVINSEGMIDYY